MLCRSLPALLLLHFAIAPAGAADWVQFRGNGGQGHCEETGLALTWSETEHVTWKVPVEGLGWSSPAIRGRQIWLTTAVDAGHSLRAVCLDRDTGRELHNVEVFALEDPGHIHTKNSHASPTPVIDGRRVYLHFGAHGTACISTDGEILWKTQELKYNHRHGPGGSPVVFEDLLLLSCDGTDVQFVVALDKTSGRIVWKEPRKHISEARRTGAKNAAMAFSTPLVIDVDGQPQLVSTGGDCVVAYEPRTGREIWWSRYDGYSLVPRPVYGHGMVYICSGFDSNKLYAIRTGGRGDVTETHVVWTLDRGAPLNPSPVLVGDELYTVNDRGVALCLDARTGKQHWQQRLGGNFSASPLYAAGRIYFSDETGTTTVIEPGTEYKELAKNEVEGRTLASLAVSDGAIFLRTDTHLYRIEE